MKMRTIVCVGDDIVGTVWMAIAYQNWAAFASTSSLGWYLRPDSQPDVKGVLKELRALELLPDKLEPAVIVDTKKLREAPWLTVCELCRYKIRLIVIVSRPEKTDRNGPGPRRTGLECIPLVKWQPVRTIPALEGDELYGILVRTLKDIPLGPDHITCTCKHLALDEVHAKALFIRAANGKVEADIKPQQHKLLFLLMRHGMRGVNARVAAFECVDWDAQDPLGQLESTVSKLRERFEELNILHSIETLGGEGWDRDYRLVCPARPRRGRAGGRGQR